ncbi:alpha/beta hydrolase [Patescibacteria group bacterium]
MKEFVYETKFIKVNGLKICTYVFGSGKKDVLLLPSFPHSGIYYTFLFSDFVDFKRYDYRYITLDFPGWIGKSERFPDEENYSIEQVLDIVKGVLKHYKIRKAHILGYSFGGAVTLKLIDELSSLTDKIALVSPFFNATISQKEFFVYITRVCKKLKLYPLYFSINRRMIQACVRRALKIDNLGEEYVNQYLDLVKNLDKYNLLNSINEIFCSDLSPALKELNNKKVLIISSRDEYKFIRKQAEFVRRKLDSEISLFFKGPHENFIVNPSKKLVKQILNFFNSG